MNQTFSQNSDMKFLVFGAGAIGTYIGGSLALAGYQVVFVERPNVVADLRAKGLRLDLTVDELEEDLITCRTRITSEIGSHACTSVLAWPANASNRQVCEIARGLGFEMAFGGVRGVARVPVRSASRPSTAGPTMRTSTRRAACCGRSSGSTAARSRGPIS